jgi:Putative transmembrane protein (PGPGW)
MSPDRETMKRRARAVYDSVPRPLRRVSVLLLGAALVLAGAAMLVLPGPGLLVLGLAVAVLALEFDWARRLAERAASLFRRLRSRFQR